MSINAKHKWIVRFYRPNRLAFNANHERSLERDGSQINHRTLKIARRSAVRHSDEWKIAIAGHIDEQWRRVVEIRIWDE